MNTLNTSHWQNMDDSQDTQRTVICNSQDTQMNVICNNKPKYTTGTAFRNFIRKGNVVDIFVAVIMGAALISYASN